MGKYFIVGGGIANFTDVAATFRGLVKALKMYRDELLAGNIKITSDVAGPNYQEGLKMMLKLRQESGLFIRVFGPEQDAERLPLGFRLSRRTRCRTSILIGEK